YTDGLNIVRGGGMTREQAAAFMKQLEAKRKAESDRRVAEALERTAREKSAKETRKEDVLRRYREWKAVEKRQEDYMRKYHIKDDHYGDINGCCGYCSHKFKVEGKDRKPFMPCPRCGKEAVTWWLSGGDPGDQFIIFPDESEAREYELDDAAEESRK